MTKILNILSSKKLGGLEEAVLKELAQQEGLDHKIRFTGWVEDKKSFYNSVDIFCAPSRYEGFGLVILEAMSYGVPVITTFSDGPKDILTHHQDGVMVKPEDPVALAEQIRRLVLNPLLGEELRQQAHKTLLKRFSFDSFTKKLDHIIKTIA